MSLHPDVFDLIEALNNAPDEVDEGIDHVYAEGVEVDITRLNFACADLSWPGKFSNNCRVDRIMTFKRPIFSFTTIWLTIAAQSD